MNVTVFKKEDFEEPNLATNKIGQGGFGIVFKLREKQTGIYYAMKVLNEEGENSNLMDSFLSEVNVLSKLNFPTIVHLYGICLTAPYYMISEYVPNKTVQYYINQAREGKPNKNWDLVHKFIIILGVSFGIQYLHSSEIIHRDLKPGNILLDLNYSRRRKTKIWKR